MVRATNAVASHRSKKRLLKLAKGFVGDRKNHRRLTSDAVMSAMAFNYRHRKERKREFAALWSMRINAAARIEGISYSKFMHGLRKSGSLLDRKILARLAMNDQPAFAAVARQAKAALA